MFIVKMILSAKRAKNTACDGPHSGARALNATSISDQDRRCLDNAGVPVTAPAASKKKKTSDWADLLALKIMADAHSYSFNEAASLIADRLRCVRQEGELAGMRKVLGQLRMDDVRAKITEWKARLGG